MLISIGLLILRVVSGLTVAAHGAQKLFGWFGGPGIGGFHGMLDSVGVRPARPWAYVAALAEFAGGLGVALGLLTPIAALAVCGSMLVAIAMVHLPKGFFNSKGGLEFPLLVLAVMVAISLIGPGAVSIDTLIHFSISMAAWTIVAVLVLIGALVAILMPRIRAASSRRSLG